MNLYLINRLQLTSAQVHRCSICNGLCEHFFRSELFFCSCDSNSSSGQGPERAYFRIIFPSLCQQKYWCEIYHWLCKALGYATWILFGVVGFTHSSKPKPPLLFLEGRNEEVLRARNVQICPDSPKSALHGFGWLVGWLVCNSQTC